MKVPGFYAAKKAQQNQGAEERGLNSPVEQNDDQLPSMVHAPTEATASFQEAFNVIPAESETAHVTAELVESGGRESGEWFEERLKEIDMEMGRFDKMRDGFSRDNIEEEIGGFKDSNPMQEGDGSTHHIPLSEDLRENGNIKEWVGKKGEREASLGSQVRVHNIAQVETLAGRQWETTHLQDGDEVHVGALAPFKKHEVKEGGPSNAGSVLGFSSISHVEERGGLAETLGPSGKDWKRLARETKPKPKSEGKSPLNIKREASSPLQNLDSNIKDLHDTPNPLQVSVINDGTAQAKWKRLPRMDMGTSPVLVGLAGSKRPMDRASDLSELPSKKILVSHSDKENHFILATAGPQPRQEQ
nr:hypothetical protein CFP56_20124 [Quercus suber]